MQEDDLPDFGTNGLPLTGRLYPTAPPDGQFKRHQKGKLKLDGYASSSDDDTRGELSGGRRRITGHSVLSSGAAPNLRRPNPDDSTSSEEDERPERPQLGLVPDGVEPKRMRPSKRLKVHNRLRTAVTLHNLPDEILILILSRLPIRTVLACQLVSRRINSVASDPYLWRALFRVHFGISETNSSLIDPLPRAAASDCTDIYPNSSLRCEFQRGQKFTLPFHKWVSRFRLRYNWFYGIARHIPLWRETISDTFRGQAVSGNIGKFILMGSWLVYCSRRMVRVWNSKTREVASTIETRCPLRPTAVAFDEDSVITTEPVFAVGYDDGSVDVYKLDLFQSSLLLIHTHTPSLEAVGDAVESISVQLPYVMAISYSREITLYRFGCSAKRPLHQLSIRKHMVERESNGDSEAIKEPVSISLRKKLDKTVASVIYTSSLPISHQTLLHLQEFDVQESPSSGRTFEVSSGKPAVSVSSGGCQRNSTSRAKEISYNFPYVLVTHTNNSMDVFYLDTDAEQRSRSRISAPVKLWGHSSGVLAASVDQNGRVVSVARGPGAPAAFSSTEVRVWETGFDPDHRSRLPLTDQFNNSWKDKSPRSATLRQRDSHSSQVQPADGSCPVFSVGSLIMSSPVSGAGLSSTVPFEGQRFWVGFNQSRIFAARSNDGVLKIDEYDMS